MDFLYIDETGKNIFSDTTSKGLYIYGGLVLNKESVNECLNKFKNVYQKHRTALNTELRSVISGTQEKSKATIISELLRNYEVHSYYMFNKVDPQKNPWAYYSIQNKYQMAFELIEAITPHIEKVFYFKADRALLTTYYDSLNMYGSSEKQTASLRDRYTEEKLVECIIYEFHSWLTTVNRKGTIIPDEFESGMREMFLSKLHEQSFDRCWNEPIIVSSNLNAFTQVADLFSYIYMKTISSRPKKFKPFKKMYFQYIEPIAVVFDLNDYLNQSNTPPESRLTLITD